MKFINHIILFSLLALPACGYHLAGTVSSLPSDIKKIAIPQFVGCVPRTIKPVKRMGEVKHNPSFKTGFV